MSLDDDKAKKIANIMNNDSCRKILDYLTEKEATESQIAKELKLPISTVHYNLSQLLEAKLIDWENYHYSEKGKEVKHYKVANKYIIITPKGDNSDIKEKLKALLPTTLVSVAGAWLLYYYNTLSTVAMKSEAVNEVADARMMALAAPVAEELPAASSSFLYSDAFWFLIGAVTSLAVYFLITFILAKLKRKDFK